MEEIRDVGYAHYQNLPQEKKKMAQKFLELMELNEEEGLECSEFERFLESNFTVKFSNCSRFFKVLDKNDDDKLKGEEVIPLYFLSQKTTFVTCNKCEALLMGAYFSCSQCFRAGHSFDLCCKCYEKRKYKHHEDAIFYDTQTLLFNIRSELRGSSSSSSSSLNNERQKEAERQFPNKEEEMDDLQLIAKAYYKKVSGDIKTKADEFFNNMDKDGNKKVSLQEYAAYMKAAKLNDQMVNEQFFNYLNKSQTGRLRRKEVMTLYYILQSGRPFCDSCLEFIKGIFFTCTQCFDTKDRSFNVCPSCFHKGSYVHDSEHQSFLDNFTLLEFQRLAALKEKRSPIKKKQGVNNYEQGPSRHRLSTSTAIVPRCPNNKDVFPQCVSVVSSLLGIGATLASLSCTIM